MKRVKRVLRKLVLRWQRWRIGTHAHDFSMETAAELSFKIGPAPAHTNLMAMTCMKCGGVRLFPQSNWDLVPEAERDRFRQILQSEALYLIESES